MATLEMERGPAKVGVATLGEKVSAFARSEALLFVILIGAAIVTRFYDLETRVMSHDESLHTYYSWLLREGRGYEHLPMMHGPLQFHLIALSYLLFGDSDATARFPAALAGVLSIALIAVFRRWLGGKGALLAGAMMLISPYMLYYTRYVRNESYVVLFSLLAAWSILRYMESRGRHWLLVLAASLALHASTKETFYIFAAQLLLFFGGFFAWRLLRRPWTRVGLKATFALGLLATLAGVGTTLVGFIGGAEGGPLGGTGTVQPLDPTAASAAIPLIASGPLVGAGLALAILGVLLATTTMLLGFGRRLREEFPELDLAIVTGTLTLPTLAALPATVLGWDAQAYFDPAWSRQTGLVLILLILASIAIGLAWNWRRWLVCAAIFWGIYLLLYTTLLTNSKGVVSGLVGSLGYWLAQHEVNRGGQPWYYYLVVQIPLYEFLPLIGCILAVGIGLRKFLRGHWLKPVAYGWLGLSSASALLALVVPRAAPEAPWSGIPAQALAVLLLLALFLGLLRIGGLAGAGRESELRQDAQENSFSLSVPAFLAYWAVTSIAAYSFAGERMPWLTVHMTLPMILLAAWAFGRLLDSIGLTSEHRPQALGVAVLIFLALLGSAAAIARLLGATPPFNGKDLDSLHATTGFITSLGVAVGSVFLLRRIPKEWQRQDLVRAGAVVGLTVLGLFTARTAFLASYVNYDQAREFLVYAHSATGVKQVLAQVQEFSRRMGDGTPIDVGYDDDVSWPFTWYLRNMSNSHYIGANPTREILNYPLIIAGDNNWHKVEPLLARRYHSFEYIRMWWPMQDYSGLSWERIWNAVSSAAYRQALWDIWFSRDYTAYGKLTGIDFSLDRWSPSDRMRLYVRKDFAGLVWGELGLGQGTAVEEELQDPYAEVVKAPQALRVVGGGGTEPGQYAAPRAIAVAADGSIYVADSRNHRVQHLSSDGELLSTWGRLADVRAGDAPGGTFNEPWGVAVAPDGSVYVADTWNYRVQRFSAEGEFIEMFGREGQGESLDALWGPRAVAVDQEGRVFVTDTGNKRIVVFDEHGKTLAQIGLGGFALGELDEPVGLAVDQSGRLYVADTWNQRIQVFEELGDNVFQAVAEWPLVAWFGQSVENKPFLAVSPTGTVCASDPEGLRILCFGSDGQFLFGWEGFGLQGAASGLPLGLAFTSDGDLWVTDSLNNRLLLLSVEE